MITQNELYDLGFVISLIRNEVGAPYNETVLDSILILMKDPTQLVDNNQIRKALSQLPHLSEKWEFTKHENYYVRTLIFKDDSIQNELVSNLTDLKLLLQFKKLEQAYDLADALHTLPEIIADNNGHIPKSYHKIFSMPYQKKWKLK